MITTTLLIGLLGILLWGHHMFVAGLNPFASSAFSISTMAIALPAAAKVLSWLATIWRSRPSYKTPMLFALGFVSLFLTGGLTGPILAQPILDEYLHNTFFVVAHFHLIMAMAGIFGLYAATYYWFPLLTATSQHPGRLLSEPLGHLHFWCTLLGAYAVFLPMHLTGLAGEPRHYGQLTGIPGPGGSLSPAGALLSHTLPLNRFITYAAIFLATAQLIFLFNLARSLRKGKIASSNPWQATTLEWHPSMNPFPHYPHPIHQRSPYTVLHVTINHVTINPTRLKFRSCHNGRPSHSSKMKSKTSQTQNRSKLSNTRALRGQLHAGNHHSQ
ncbi:cbb3-type cytochrome c oxidase subunit I [Tunturiibacter empetritectus]|uniref:cytochrome c oxidase subunit I n=1 Tax=Tunturiibacter empetritectus TaxID=3069691 RepID=UPI003D9AEF1F